MSNQFSRAVRLWSHAEFQIVQRRGRRVSARFVTLVGQPNDHGRDRLGIIASRRIGSAVMRNRAKRRLREIFRQGDPAGAASRGRRAFDVVAIARRELIDAPFADVSADVRSALRRLCGEK
jgi:ribonuclease P protein component